MTQKLSSSQVSTQPIEDMYFSGLHWIEASAGSGKTYTLSSLMVRILLEKYLPAQVIATTFTRKAAAELKSRIRARAVDTLAYLDQCRELTEQDIQRKAENEKDPLFATVLKGFSGRIAYACERLKLVIDQLDELFVGTLDSFSQKLLREFAFESGKIERAEITDDARRYSFLLIHDVLREWIQQQPQPVIDYLLLNKKLKSQEAYVSVVESSLNFSSAKFQEVVQPDIQLEAFSAQMTAFSQLDLAQLTSLSAYYLAEGEYHGIVAKKWRDHAKLQRLLTEKLPAFISGIQQQGAYALYAPEYAETLKQLADLLKKPLNKCPENVLADFEQHPVIQAVRVFIEELNRLTVDLELLDSYLKFHLATEVRKRLPQVLQQKGETTFAQQIRTLADALQEEGGQRFAAHIHARYPLILVDEFQDTNQDQDNLLAQVWRNPVRVKLGCMIMVGDRKQAIYGFRGGDMLTFLKAQTDVSGQSGRMYNLIYNHRSVKPLVEVVDALFQQQPDFGEQVIYSPVQAGSRPHPDLVDEQQINPSPLRWIQLEDKSKEAEQVAWKVCQLLNQGVDGSLFFSENGIQRPVCENDIAVLCKGHRGLDQAQSALEYMGIRTSRPSRKSVFSSMVAKDTGAVLTAIMFPYDEPKVKRALLSRLCGFNLQTLMELEALPDGLSRYMEQFDLIREMWLNQGFLTAWHYCLDQFSVWQNLVSSFSRDNERAVVNLRHLNEVLSQHSEQYQGAQNLYHWYLKQLTSPMEREWEMERRLSSEAGVQLMTIHQSKGLEFRIVFLLEADKAFRERDKPLNFSTVEQFNERTGKMEQQRVVAVNDKHLVEQAAVTQHEERALAEHHRIWYVALTRASYRVYAMLSDDKGKSTGGLAYWRGQGEQIFQHQGSVMEPQMMERPVRKMAHESPVQRDLQAQVFPDQRFYAKAKTSFSALAQHLTRQQIQDALAVAELSIGGAEDEPVYVPETEDTVLEQDQPVSWIKANFPMGTVAGNFLHEIFEHIQFADSSEWLLEIHRRFKNDYSILLKEVTARYQTDFPEQEQSENILLSWIAEWLQQVLDTPLQGSFHLGQLKPDQYLSEFPFQMALADRVPAVKRIHQLFADEGIVMPEFNAANAARYLQGSIDLVFHDGQQYHIADYKSNFLGKDQQQYRTEAIQESMSFASYWLQAAVYLVALHRYLKVQLDDYEIDRDLGGASYLYLRGMNGQAQQGYVYWRPSSEFILRLDALLGHLTVQADTVLLHETV